MFIRSTQSTDKHEIYFIFDFQMLNCIMGMVDKTKRALNILQQRNVNNFGQTNLAQNFGSGLTGFSSGSNPFEQSGVDPLTRRTMEMVVEVRRKAEEAVSEVKIKIVQQKIYLEIQLFYPLLHIKRFLFSSY